MGSWQLFLIGHPIKASENYLLYDKEIATIFSKAETACTIFHIRVLSKYEAQANR